jgi:hypothetical protein
LRCPRPEDQYHLDEVFLTIKGRTLLALAGGGSGGKIFDILARATPESNAQMETKRERLGITMLMGKLIE